MVICFASKNSYLTRTSEKKQSSILQRAPVLLRNCLSCCESCPRVWGGGSPFLTASKVSRVRTPNPYQVHQLFQQWRRHGASAHDQIERDPLRRLLPHGLQWHRGRDEPSRTKRSDWMSGSIFSQWEAPCVAHLARRHFYFFHLSFARAIVPFVHFTVGTGWLGG